MSTNSKEKLRQLLAQYDASQNKEVIEPAEPVVSVEPVKVDELVEPVEPVERVEPVEPVKVDELVEPVKVVEPVDEQTKVLSKDLLRQQLNLLSEKEQLLESSVVSSESISPSVESIIVSESDLSRVDDTVSLRDEFVEGMVEGLPDFKSDSKDNGTLPIETEDETNSLVSDNELVDTEAPADVEASVDVEESTDVSVEESAGESDESVEKSIEDTELVDGETLVDTTSLPTFDNEETSSESSIKRAFSALKRRPGVVVTVCGLVLVTALISVAALSGSSKKATPSSPSSADAKVIKKLAKSSSSSSKQLSIEEQLTATAKANDRPYKVEVEDLVGGYKLGKITYYPDNEAKRYTDMSLHAPTVAEPVDTSDAAKAINDDLAKELPTINSTIKVKNKDKVTFETYAKDNGFVTILLYNKKPFGYVTTDSEGYKTNHVTTFYVSDVAAND